MSSAKSRGAPLLARRRFSAVGHVPARARRYGTARHGAPATSRCLILVVSVPTILLTVYARGPTSATRPRSAFFFPTSLPLLWIGAFAPSRVGPSRAVALWLAGRSRSPPRGHRHHDGVQQRQLHVPWRRAHDAGELSCRRGSPTSAATSTAGDARAARPAAAPGASRRRRDGVAVALAARPAPSPRRGGRRAVGVRSVRGVPGWTQNPEDGGRTGGNFAQLGWVDRHVPSGARSPGLEQPGASPTFVAPTTPDRHDFYNDQVRRLLLVPALHRPDPDVTLLWPTGHAVEGRRQRQADGHRPPGQPICPHCARLARPADRGTPLALSPTSRWARACPRDGRRAVARRRPGWRRAGSSRVSERSCRRSRVVPTASPWPSTARRWGGCGKLDFGGRRPGQQAQPGPVEPHDRHGLRTGSGTMTPRTWRRFARLAAPGSRRRWFRSHRAGAGFRVR